MNDNNLKPAVLIWVLIKDVLKMGQGVMPQTWVTDYNQIQNHSNFVQIIVPCDYFAKLYEIQTELELQTRDLIL